MGEESSTSMGVDGGRDPGLGDSGAIEMGPGCGASLGERAGTTSGCRGIGGKIGC